MHTLGYEEHRPHLHYISIVIVYACECITQLHSEIN